MEDILFAGFAGLAGSGTLTLVLLLKATIILLAALGITLMMQQRFSAGARHVVWLVAVAALLLVPALAAWGPIPVRILPAAQVGSPSPTASRSPSPKRDQLATDDAGASFSASASGTEADAGGSISAAPQASLFAWMSGVSFLLLIWATVVVAIAASLGFAALSVRRIVRRSQPLDSRDWLDPLFEVSDRLGLDEPPVVVRSEDAKMPFACGVMKPTIVLPAECDTWTLDRRRAVLLHELAHVKRHDLVGHTIGRLACAFYWFHPLVWTAAKNLRAESERACDDLAISCGARPTDYAEHLLDIVTSVRRDSTPSVALAMARRKEFEGRMLAILDPELRHSTPSRRQSFGLICSLALMVIIIGAAAPAPRVGGPSQAEIASLTAGHDVGPARTAPSISGKDTLDDSLRDERADVYDNANDNDNDQDYPDADLDVEIGRATAESIAATVATSVSAAVSASVGNISENISGKVSKGASRSALMDLVYKGQGSSAARDSDERPTLLARVLLSDPNAELREIAAWGLHEHADGTVAANALATAVRRDVNADVREMAAWALHDADRSSVVIDALGAALRGDANVKVRATAAWTLGQIGDPSGTDHLLAGLADASMEVRRRSVWGIGQIEPRQAPRGLIAMLNDADPETRELTAWALFRIEDPAAIPALDAALRKETSKDLQISYIRALAAVGERSVDALRGLLESTDPEIKKIAVRALAGGNATGPWPRPWPQPRPFP